MAHVRLTRDQRRLAHVLAGLAGVHFRTAAKFVAFGPDAVTHHEPRMALERVAAQLGSEPLQSAG
jgi:hypothetical protein